MGTSGPCGSVILSVVMSRRAAEKIKGIVRLRNITYELGARSDIHFWEIYLPVGLLDVTANSNGIKHPVTAQIYKCLVEFGFPARRVLSFRIPTPDRLINTFSAKGAREDVDVVRDPLENRQA